MFKFNKDAKIDPLELQIAQIYSALAGMDASEEEYDKTTDQLVKLLKLKKETQPSWQPSPDAVVGVVGSLVSIILVLQYEKIGVVTSKALGFVTKLK